MGEQKAQMVWTDPPYGVNYVGKTENKLKIHNDGCAGLKNLLSKTFKTLDQHLVPGSPVYVAHPAGPNSLVFGEAFLATGWSLRQTLVWVKDSMVLGHSDYHYKHEPILFGYKVGEGRLGRGGKTWQGDNAQTSVFEFPRPKASVDHPTMKPVALVEAMLLNSSRIGSLVLDPFCGSGTTLLAAEKNGRTCFAMEISPGYCDVIVKRWEEFTAQTAVRNPPGRSVQ
jgi:DNA modification methylase